MNLATLPSPKEIGVSHIVVVMMENRSFDHMLGWVPMSDGKQAGLEFKHKDGKFYKTHDLGAANNFNGNGWADPNHSYSAGRKHFNNGHMDGFLLTDNTPVGDLFPIGYYSESAVPFFSGVSKNFTICDRYHSGILASTRANRMYIHCGQTDRVDGTNEISSLETIWDLLARAKVSHKYYFSDLPELALFGTRYLKISNTFKDFKKDAKTGQLPEVCFVDPKFLIEPLGTSNDDHPIADIRNGQFFLNSVYNILRKSPQWSKTLLIVIYDEWGGFFDHVAPPIAPVSKKESELGNDGRLGFRVPCMLIGPKVKKNHVCKLQLDPNSILNFISWRFNLDKLGIRGDSSINLAYALNLEDGPNLSAPSFNVTKPSNVSVNFNLKSLTDRFSDVVHLYHLASYLGFDTGNKVAGLKRISNFFK